MADPGCEAAAAMPTPTWQAKPARRKTPATLEDMPEDVMGCIGSFLNHRDYVRM